jgi:hypothetical protein
VNDNLGKLIKERKKNIIKNARLSIQLEKYLLDLNQICIKIHTYNRYFSILNFTIFFLVIPTANFFLFNLIYIRFNSLLASVTMMRFLIILSSIMLMNGLMAAMFESEVRKTYPLLCSLLEIEKYIYFFKNHLKTIEYVLLH